MNIRRIGRYIFFKTSAGSIGFREDFIDQIWPLEHGGVGFTLTSKGGESPIRFGDVTFSEFVSLLTGKEELNKVDEVFLNP